MKHIEGKAININSLLMGEYTDKNSFRSNKILFCKKKPLFTHGIIAYIVPKGKAFKTKLPILEIENDVPFINGDLITISPEGLANVFWEFDSPHNALYVTDLCNSKCIMCPQIEGQKSRYDECLKMLDLINLKQCESIGITGGEPTLNIDKLVAILTKISQKKKGQDVHILTNGRLFAHEEIVNKLASIPDIKISFGIPLYSDIAEEHDYIVGVDGAFEETIKGLYNLAKHRMNIEIRTVILKQNYKKLRDIALYIYRNLPFISKVALMSMEYHGNAETNYNIVAIDPTEYKEELFNAVRDYVRYNIVVDVYNTPLCLINPKIEAFAKDSISTWKKTFLPACEGCIKKDICSGVFATSFKHSSNIKPFKEPSIPVHKKPVDNTPTPLLVDHIQDIINSTQNSDLVIDMACGYGRNSFYLASQNIATLGIDNSKESLHFIENNKNGLNITTKNINLSNINSLELNSNISAIVNVHYYTDQLLKVMMTLLKPNGILLIETIDGHHGNYMDLPRENYIKDQLQQNNFEIIYYKENLVNPKEQKRVSVKVVARKKEI